MPIKYSTKSAPRAAATYEGTPVRSAHVSSDGATKRAHYADGVGPDSDLAMSKGAGTMGDLASDAPMRSSPAAGPRPDRKANSKAAEVQANDPNAGLGEAPHGTLGRR